jgi:alcohol dehydrogenase (cytochrome c)
MLRIAQVGPASPADGINAPPMTYAVNGRQYIAVASGLCCVRPSGQVANTKSRVARTPELREMSQATVLYVFGL